MNAMPCDYSKYPPNWKTEIRPAVLARANNCCEICKAPNKSIAIRGMWKGIEVYQNFDAEIFRFDNGEHIGDDYLGDLDGKVTSCIIVLTVAHLDHDTTNNSMENLKALCQKHHLAHDKHLHMSNSKTTRDKKKGQLNLL